MSMSDTPPDRLSNDPNSPYYDADALAREVGIRFKGAEKTNVEEYCISEGWIRVERVAFDLTCCGMETDQPVVSHCVFDTAIGTCGVAWSPRGLVAVQLPA